MKSGYSWSVANGEVFTRSSKGASPKDGLPSVERRLSSATVPEQVNDVLMRSDYLENCYRHSWERQKLARLYSGEVITTPEVMQMELSQGCLHVPTGTIFLDSGKVFRQSTVRLEDFLASGIVPSGDWSQRIGLYASLVTRWAGNYAHWLFDSLPRVAISEVLERNETFILPQNPSRFHRESLKLLGIEKERCLVPDQEVLRLERLIMVSTAVTSGIPNGHALRKLRERFREAVGLSGQPATGKPLYILREKPSPAKSQRRLINEPEVRRVLMDFGFEVIVPEDLSFEEQVRKFAEAPILVGPHGAGNFNLMYMAPGTAVVELFNPECWEHTSVRLSGMLGLRHYHLFGINRTKDHLFEIDPKRLRKLMCLVLGGEHLADAVETVF